MHRSIGVSPLFMYSWLAWLERILWAHSISNATLYTYHATPRYVHHASQPTPTQPASYSRPGSRRGWLFIWQATPQCSQRAVVAEESAGNVGRAERSNTNYFGSFKVICEEVWDILLLWRSYPRDSRKKRPLCWQPCVSTYSREAWRMSSHIHLDPFFYEICPSTSPGLDWIDGTIDVYLHQSSHVKPWTPLWITKSNPTLPKPQPELEVTMFTQQGETEYCCCVRSWLVSHSFLQCQFDHTHTHLHATHPLNHSIIIPRKLFVRLEGMYEHWLVGTYNKYILLLWQLRFHGITYYSTAERTSELTNGRLQVDIQELIDCPSLPTLFE